MRKCVTRVLLVTYVAAFLPGRAAAEDGRLIGRAPEVLATAHGKAEGTAAATTGPENPVLTFFKQTQVSGFVDVSYSYNFNTPATPCAVVSEVKIFNCLHAFDVAQKSFQPESGRARPRQEADRSQPRRLPCRSGLWAGSHPCCERRPRRQHQVSALSAGLSQLPPASAVRQVAA